MMKYFGLMCLIIAFLLCGVSLAHAQRTTPTPHMAASASANIDASSSAIASAAAAELAQLERLKKENITVPEESGERKEFLKLFAQRPITNLTPFNFIGFFVQYAVQVGIPANTITLILLLPFLTTIIVFSRQIIGLPSLEMLVPVAFSITLISTGIVAGTILLITILLASMIARMMLKKLRIMQLPKMALSILLVAACVLIALTISASVGILAVKQISFFPILVLILLTEKIVSVQLTRNYRQAFLITWFTIVLGLVGYSILSSDVVRSYILLYPEFILALIPINLIMGRYFGLRLTEFYRFSSLRKYVD